MGTSHLGATCITIKNKTKTGGTSQVPLLASRLIGKRKKIGKTIAIPQFVPPNLQFGVREILTKEGHGPKLRSKLSMMCQF